MWRFDRAPDCLARHAYVLGSNPADLVWEFQKNIFVSPFSMRLDDHVNGGLVEVSSKPVYLR